MNQGGTFNIDSTVKPVNHDLVITYTPDNTAQYTYQIFKDNQLITNKDTNTSFNTTLMTDGEYKIKIIVNDNIVSTKTYIIDKTKPIIRTEKIQIHKGDKINISATDNYDGDLGSKVKIDNYTNSIGNHVYKCIVSDSAGNVTTKNIDVNILPSYNLLIMLQFILIIIFIVIFSKIISLKKSINIDERINRFTLQSLKENDESLIDKWFNNFEKSIKKFSSLLKKSVFLSKYAKRLEKYCSVSLFNTSGFEILAFKFVMSILFVFITFIAKIIQFKLILPYEIVLPLLAGFFMPDILYFIKYRIYQNFLENDLLSAIIIMNNAFRSGRSIVQAINIVGDEMNGVMAKEFKKMALELSYGLDISVVFKRFGKRIQINEINYLAASLTILNKTGGNIIKVFDSIEKSLFNKKKLRLELRSLTGASRVIVWALIVVPFVFIIAVTLLDPSYFQPFYNTPIGIFMLIFMIIYYMLFIYCVNKIMKVVI